MPSLAPVQKVYTNGTETAHLDGPDGPDRGTATPEGPPPFGHCVQRMVEQVIVSRTSHKTGRQKCVKIDTLKRWAARLPLENLEGPQDLFSGTELASIDYSTQGEYLHIMNTETRTYDLGQLPTALIGREGTILEGPFILTVRIIGVRSVFGRADVQVELTSESAGLGTKWVHADKVRLFLERLA